MCDFKVGDEVVCVDAMRAKSMRRPTGAPVGLVEGRIYTVRRVGVSWFDPAEAAVWLQETDNVGGQGYRDRRFRKVQRRDLTAWLKASIGNTDKLDKRQTKKVRA